MYEPAAFEHVTEYVVVRNKGPVLSVPLGARLPRCAQPSPALQLVAVVPVLDQVKSVVVPIGIFVDPAVNSMVGGAIPGVRAGGATTGVEVLGGALVTATATDLVCVPDGFTHDNVYVVLVLGLSVSVPVGGLGPFQPALAVQLGLGPVTFQAKVTGEPGVVLLGVTVKVMSGAPVFTDTVTDFVCVPDELSHVNV